ncbi:MAG: type II CAAX prenyl endopeptidase Rce1 family protein [Nitrospira sp.]
MHDADPTERLAWLAGLPIAATIGFDLLPSDLQQLWLIQLLPQAIAYVALGFWASQNPGVISRLGLQRAQLPQGLRWGTATGLVLGLFNTTVILYLVPRLGFDIGFLRETPHAQIPLAVMLPWFIVLIAFFVEINFRGFLLGRLRALFSTLPGPVATGAAVAVSALTFSFDPFMVLTFRHLHWIAVWDGLIWGFLWVRLRNLYVPIVAHAAEVIVLYLVLRMMVA